MQRKTEQVALTLVQAAHLLMAQPPMANRVSSAIRALTQAQGHVANALVRLQSAAKAIDAIEPLLKRNPQDKVQSIEQFRKFYAEISTKLNDLTSSLAAVNSELMPLAEQPTPPPAPAAQET